METMTTTSETDGIPPPPLQKVILIGESGVGKSSLVARYQKGQFRHGHTHSTVAVAHSYVNEEIHSSTKVRYSLWDTGGTERFRCMFPQYFREAHVAVIAYDVTCEGSFKAAETLWRRELLRHVPFVHVILVGTKTDLLDARMVSTKGQALAERCGCKFLETSAASGENVDVLFLEIATILARLQSSFHLELSLKTAAIRVRHPPPEKTHKRRCCVLS